MSRAAAASPARKTALEVFAGYAHYTMDPFWKTVLQNCSKGVFPRGLRFDDRDGTLYCRDGKKTEAIILPAQRPAGFELMMKLFERLRLRPTAEFDMGLLAIPKVDDSDEWSKVPKRLKDGLLLDFAERVAGPAQLLPGAEAGGWEEFDQEDREKLLACLKLGLHIKALAPDDIVVRDGEIRSVTGLELDPAARTFAFASARCPPKESKATPGNDPLLAYVRTFVKEIKGL